MWCLGSACFLLFTEGFFLSSRQDSITRHVISTRGGIQVARPCRTAERAGLRRSSGRQPSSSGRPALRSTKVGAPPVLFRHSGPVAGSCEAVLSVSCPRPPSRPHPPTSVQSMRSSGPHMWSVVNLGEDLGVHSGEHDSLVTEHSMLDLSQHAVLQSRLAGSALSPEPQEDPYASTSSPAPASPSVLVSASLTVVVNCAPLIMLRQISSSELLAPVFSPRGCWSAFFLWVCYQSPAHCKHSQWSPPAHRLPALSRAPLLKTPPAQCGQIAMTYTPHN